MPTLADLVWVLWTVLLACPSDMVPIGFSCMDRFEAPNIEGARPLTMLSGYEAEMWCAARGKRLCSRYEWESACALSGTVCNNRERWLPFDPATVASPAEVERLWQGSPSGAFPECRTPSGIYDLLGNVEEWVSDHTLKGGWWARRTSCGQTNKAHWGYFRFYQIGFRCCI